jgi:hypothetical protein
LLYDARNCSEQVRHVFHDAHLFYWPTSPAVDRIDAAEHKNKNYEIAICATISGLV